MDRPARRPREFSFEFLKLARWFSGCQVADSIIDPPPAA